MDYLGAEPLLLERLREQVEGVRAVLSAADLAGVAESKQPTPALHVLYGGYTPGEQLKGSQGRVQASHQRWVVVVAVRNLRTPHTGEDARGEAGPLLSAVLEALQGWRPSAEHTPLELAAGPAPGFSKGYGYFPLAFATRVVTRGT